MAISVGSWKERPWDTDLLFAVVGGNSLYGLPVDESSSVNIFGVCRMPISSMLGLTRFEGYRPEDNPEARRLAELLGIYTPNVDYRVYGLTHFFGLALKGNLSALELLFVKGSQALLFTDEWECVVENRGIFLSRRILRPHKSMAQAQLAKLQRGVCEPKSAAHCYKVLCQCFDLLLLGEIVFPFDEERIATIINMLSGKLEIKDVEVIIRGMAEGLSIPELDYLPEVPNRAKAETLLVELNARGLPGRIIR